MTQKFKRTIDHLIIFGAILYPIVSLPQLIKIWVRESAADVSFLAWTGYLIGASVLFTYGIVHKEKPLIVFYGAMVLVDIAIIISIVIFNGGFL
jgi:uncharacterized protein with PQ loop repeat